MVGWGVTVQLPLFRLAGFEVVALAVHSESKVEATRKLIKEKYPEKKEGEKEGEMVISANWKEIVALPQVDLVSIVTPPYPPPPPPFPPPVPLFSFPFPHLQSA